MIVATVTANVIPTVEEDILKLNVSPEAGTLK